MMNINTFQRLQQVRDKFGPGIFGKIAQKLLAIAFYEAGFHHVVERGVQGVDIDAAREDATRYTLEVKTTEGQSVPVTKENIEALKDRTKDGYVPLLAVLRMQMFEDWLFAAVPLERLQPGSVTLSRLRSYRLSSLEASIRPKFEQVVNEHWSSVLTGGEHYLIQILGEKTRTR
jgi:Holliday junction resolvase